MLNSEEPWAAVRAPVAQDQPAKAAAVQATAQAVQSPGPKIKQRKFANGDRYVGGWQNGLPEGEGKYEWSDGSSYEGGWKAGAKHGVGRYIWNSGASYQGGWQDGCMHGVGAFEAPDGSRYQGGWKEDLKHGLGRKIYANGDAYEGLWAQGKPDGPGRYIWVDFNEYDGEWRAGRMSGQGTFVWKTGERYDGEWKDGQENGVGVFTFRDGSTYSGFWRSGKKHGVGIYRPAYSSKSGNSASDSKSAKEAALSSGGSRAAFADAAAAAAALPDEAAAEFMHRSTANGQAVAGSAAGKAPAAQAGMGRQQSGERMQQQGQPQQPAQQTQQQQQPASDVVLVKEYKEGKLVRQFPLSNSTLAQIFTAFNGPAAAAARTSSAGTGAAAGSSSRHLSVTPLGEVLYEDRSAYELQQQLQLGIRWSVAGKALNQDPTSNESADLLPDDFIATSKQEFPRSGSKITSVHPSDDFIWKDYAPSVFRYLRMLAGLQPGDYISSLCSDQSLQLLASPGGRTGAMFYITADEIYVVKTVTRAEAKLLMKLLPQYMQHMVQQPGTLITRFYGLHRVEPVHGRGKKVRFVVMGNVMCSGLPIHKRFDLKGSTAGRSTPAEAVEADSSLVLKDLDLHQCFKLQGGIGGRLKAQLMADTSFLAANGLMDYSMLLGVHYKDHHQQQQQHDCRNLGLHDPDAGLDTVVSQFEKHLNSMQLDQRLAAALVELAKAGLLAGDVHAAHNPKLALQMRCPVMALATRPLRNPSSSISRPLPPGPDQQQGAIVLGQHMLATAVPLNAKQALTTGDTDDLHSQPQAHPVVLYFGITDLLQSYTLPKKLESAAKRLTAPAASISAVAPGYYAKRFRKFMAQVFV